MSLNAVIPVRAGSKRLKNKNVAPFAGTNLLVNKINQLKQVKEINQIYVSSDSDDMLKMAIALGVKTHKRDIEYCDEESKSFGEVISHVCSNIQGEHILWATCTAPLVQQIHYQQAILEYYNALQHNFDSLMSFEEIHCYLWDQNGPMNYEFGLSHVSSQSLSPLYIPTFGITIAPRKDMINWNYFHGTNPYKFLLEKRISIDIDDGLDLATARAWLDLDETVMQSEYFTDIRQNAQNLSKNSGGGGTITKFVVVFSLHYLLLFFKK